MKFIREQKNLRGKTVLLSADFDAPEENCEITDDFRIRMAVPTINFLYGAGAKIIILSKNGHKTNRSLEPAAARLAKLLNKKFAVASDGASENIPDYDIGAVVLFKGDILKPENRSKLLAAAPQNITVLENIRFYPEETAADINFGKTLAELGNIYVNDDFAMAHRSEASITVIPRFLPAYAGLNFEKEINNLQRAMTLRAKPFLVMLGGAKISDKIGTIENLGKDADAILIGGGPSNLFFYAKGYEIGKSLCEKDQKHLAEDLMRNFKDKIVLPLDVVVAEPETFSNVRVTSPDQIRSNEAVYDIGPKTILAFSKHIKEAKKMIWNGPMGFFENKTFSHGSIALAAIFAGRCGKYAFGVVGGGDTLSAVNQAGVADQIDFVSTGGSATLDFLGGEKLPAIEALNASK